MTKYIIHHVEYLDLNHRYNVVIALKKELEDSLFDCHFFDDEGDIKEGLKDSGSMKRSFFSWRNIFLITSTTSAN